MVRKVKYALGRAKKNPTSPPELTHPWSVDGMPVYRISYCELHNKSWILFTCLTQSRLARLIILLKQSLTASIKIISLFIYACFFSHSGKEAIFTDAITYNIDHTFFTNFSA